MHLFCRCYLFWYLLKEAHDRVISTHRAIIAHLGISPAIWTNRANAWQVLCTLTHEFTFLDPVLGLL